MRLFKGDRVYHEMHGIVTVSRDTDHVDRCVDFAQQRPTCYGLVDLELENGSYATVPAVECQLVSRPADRIMTSEAPTAPDGLAAPPPPAASRYDQDKLRMSISPWLGFAEVMAVAEYGAKKYDAHNFRKGLQSTALADAAFRHLAKWMAGEDVDPDSGCEHLAHAAWNLLVALEQKVRGNHGLDDRYQFEPTVRISLQTLLGEDR